MARPHLRRLPLAGFLAIVMVAAGCTIPMFRADNEGNRGGAGPDWKACPEVPRKLVGRGAPGMKYECATISVPADWNAAGGAGTDGEGLEIALLRIRSSKQRARIGSLLVNPGGPGGSGIDSAVYLSFGAGLGGLRDEVTQRFDIVGFDPRGVSRSSPVTCVSDADLDRTFGFDPDPASQADFDELVVLSRKIGDACGDKYGDRLRLFATEQAARDMDAIRTAVGDERLSYLGYSYGTLLGATYAQLFPRNVRALVLDGAVDPRQDLVASSESQAKGFERAFTNFTTWCAGTPTRCPLAPDARRAVTDAMAKARISPTRGEGGREATAGWIFYAVISSLYTEAGWQKLAAAVASLAEGDPKEIFELADSYAERDSTGHYTNLFDANLSVNCADEDTKVGLDRIRSLQSRWRTKYPLFGAPLAVGMLSCEFWPGQRDPYPTGSATGAPPIVVVGTIGDPATPYEQTPKLADMLAVGVVLTWQGEGHTAYPQTRCITDAVDEYLIDLKPPSAGTTCPAR